MLADSHYCPMCGAVHGGEAEAEAIAEVAAVEEVSRADVEIARINADRDIRLARINAGVLDQERDAELAHAEGKAEGVVETLETLAPDPEPAPVVVEADPEPEPELVPEVPAPPVDDDHQDHEPRPPKSRGLGMWGG